MPNPPLTDGDQGWTGVNDRLSPAMLAPGILSEGENVTVEFGDIRPRWGVAVGAWGVLEVDTPLALAQFHDPDGYEYLVVVTDADRAEDGGKGRAWKVCSGQAPAEIPLNGHDVWGTARLVKGRGSLILLRHGLARYYWAERGDNFDLVADTLTLNTVEGLYTGDKIKVSYAGGGVNPLSPTEYWLALKGANQIACYRSRTEALREQGWADQTTTHRARTANVATLTTATAHGLNSGEKITVTGLGGTGYNLTGVTLTKIDATTFTYPAPGGEESSTADTGGTVALTPLRIDLTSVIANTRLYLEKVETYLGTGETGGTTERDALPLELKSLASGSSIIESWVNGFRAARTSLDANIDAGTTDFRCANHAFLPGQAVKITAGAGAAGFDAETTYWVNPLDQNRFTLHDGEVESLGGKTPLAATGTAGVYSVTFQPLNFSGAPMPAGREGLAVFNRLVIACRKDGLAISDPADYLHFSPYTAAKVANLGESTPINALAALGSDTLLLCKADAVLGVAGLNGEASGWQLLEVTREYGCTAPLSCVNVGKDVWFLSAAQRGIASVNLTLQGEAQGVTVPVSHQISDTMKLIDWSHAEQAAGAWFGNRYLLAVPLKGQTGIIKNNAVLVYNFLTQGWDGVWSGETLDVVQFARHTVNGQLRLCFVSADAVVRWFDPEALTDMAANIRWRWVSRGYDAKVPILKRWTHLALALSTWRPRFSVTAIAEGVGEELPLRTNLELNPAKSFLFNTAVTVPGGREAGREDYSLISGDAGLTAAANAVPGVFQAVTLAATGWAVRDRSLRIEMSGDRGSVRVRSLMLQATAEEPLPYLQPS